MDAGVSCVMDQWYAFDATPPRQHQDGTGFGHCRLLQDVCQISGSKSRLHMF